MAKKPAKLKVIWEEMDLPDAAERLAAAFEMLLAGDGPAGSVQKQDLDASECTDNDQITNPLSSK